MEKDEHANLQIQKAQKNFSFSVESSSIVRVTNVMHCNVMAKYMQSNWRFQVCK